MFPMKKVVYLWLLLSVVTLPGIRTAYSQEMDLPDLVISSISYSPPLPHPNDWVTFTVEVMNIGTAATVATTARVTIDGGDATTHNIPALAPGETYQFQRTDKVVAFGKHTITAVADWNDDVEESNEDNNEKTVFVYVAKQNTYDLTLETLTHSPENPTNYDMITITAIVRSVGPLTPTTTTLEIKINDEATPAYYTVPPLSPMEIFQGERQVKLNAGSYTVQATADFGNIVTEAYEDNNTATDSFEIMQAYLPDLVLESLSHAPMNPYSIDAITLTAFVRNIGNTEATTSTLEIKVGDEPAPALFTIPTLAIDEGTTIQRQVVLSEAGSYL
ncbi:hypothetical protein JW926_01890, partial [Candidatus Sumerlaeota bacterium]|nr:hypothetical protein [Candidatus Sumerlaeota bacterium]